MKTTRKKKSSPMSSLLIFLIFVALMTFVSEHFITLIIALVVIIVIVIGYIIKNNKKTGNEKSPISQTPISRLFQTPEWKLESIKRHMTIFLESANLVNTSYNLETVIRRYTVLRNTLMELCNYTDSEIEAAGYKLKSPLMTTLDSVQSNKISIVNQAIERHIKSKINSLKTTSGKLSKLDTIYNDIKTNSTLEDENLSFLEDFYLSMKKELDADFVSTDSIIANNCALAETEKTMSGTYLDFSQLSPNVENFSMSTNIPQISSEIASLIWIGDGSYKNYPSHTKQHTTNTIFSVSFSATATEEPSVLYLSLHILKPANDTLVERPPYYPIYKELSPEQKWLYWEFLSEPFSPKHNIGYVFLFYYGLERHLAFGNIDQAFDIILKLRKNYNNNSFQLYTAQALVLTCIAKQRADLALKFMESEPSSIPMRYLILLKYTFQMLLTAAEIIKNYQYFTFGNNRYIKSQPELFLKTLSNFMERDFHSSALEVNRLFPVDIANLPVEHERVFANISLRDYEISIPVFENSKLTEKILSLLTETHESVKAQLRDQRKDGINTPAQKSNPKTKLSPIEIERIPSEVVFDFSDVENWTSWSNKRILETYYELSNIIMNEKLILLKLEACEKSYKILKPVIKIFSCDPAGLPPAIACRDYGPCIYKRLGNWNDAERAIRACMDANAYRKPNEGKVELEQLIKYKEIAETTIDFIKKNPGFLQKNIYTALLAQIGEENIPLLKTFIRETYVFHKQPYKASNQLYYVERM